MRRIALPLGRRLFVAVAVLGMLVLTLPARLVAGWLDLDGLGVSARAIEGSVWRARASEVAFAGMPLGDLDARLEPLALLTARARIGFGGGAEGALTVSRHETGIVVDRLRLPVGERLAPLPVAAATFEGVRAAFRDGLCARAEGAVRVELAADPALALPGSLAGAVRCESGALVLPLASASGGERLTLRLGSDRVHAELLLAGRDPAARAGLVASGFAPAPAGYALGFDTAW